MGEELFVLACTYQETCCSNLPMYWCAYLESIIEGNFGGGGAFLVADTSGMLYLEDYDIEFLASNIENAKWLHHCDHLCVCALAN